MQDEVSAVPGADESAGGPTLSRRGQEFLASIRRHARADGSPDGLMARSPPIPSQPTRPVATAFVVAAGESAEPESAAIALARQLVAPAGQTQHASGGVGLLMLDPLGATLRLFAARNGARSDGPPPGPQFRVANRSEWPVLLARLNGHAHRLLVLDLTGQQHRLMPRAAPVVIIAATPDRDGRLACYRKLKELDRDGVGQIGMFFVAPQTYPAEPPPTPLAHRAATAFARLAETAEKFLSRKLVFFGSANDRPGQTVAAEMLGQRPSTDGHENRAELTRWLEDNSQPMACTPDEPGQAEATPLTPRMLTLTAWPADEAELGRLLADNELLGTPLTPLAFHPPIDPAATLAARAGSQAELFVIRAADAGCEAEALTMLLATANWANEHWELLRLAFASVNLPESPRMTPMLAGEQVDAPPVRAAAAAAGVELIRLVRIDLPPDSKGMPQVGLVLARITQISRP